MIMTLWHTINDMYDKEVSHACEASSNTKGNSNKT